VAKRSEQDRVKRRCLDEWVQAANEHGGFGYWRWDLAGVQLDLAAAGHYGAGCAGAGGGLSQVLGVPHHPTHVGGAAQDVAGALHVAAQAFVGLASGDGGTRGSSVTQSAYRLG
jgi:hypothetical protein